MHTQQRATFAPSGTRVARAVGGKRIVAARAADRNPPQPPALDEVLEAGSVIGSAAFDVLTEEAVEVAAEASRMQTEQFRILSRLPEDPQGALQDLMQDIQSRELPSVSDVMDRATSVMVRSHTLHDSPSRVDDTSTVRMNM